MTEHSSATGSRTARSGFVVRGQEDVSVAHLDWPGLTIDLTELRH